MEAKLLNQRVVFVKDPTVLPQSIPHHEAIAALAKNNKLVLLLSHGNKYTLPLGWILPHNAIIIEYALTNEDIVQNVYRVRNLLNLHGIDMYSRHLDNDDPMPMLLAGACLTLSPGTKVAFVNKPEQYLNAKQDPDPVKFEDIDWDLLN